MTNKGLTTGEAAKYLGRHPKTLQVWDVDGTLPARRTKGGRRYWLKEDLDAFLARTSANLRSKQISHLCGFCSCCLAIKEALK